MSRVIAGVVGNRPLWSVPGEKTRPTTDRVKEALFSRLEAFSAIYEARVLDLYAGSGALGVESASRGAASVVLVEKDRQASNTCRRNADMVNRGRGSDVVRNCQEAVERFLSFGHGLEWDLVFMDPPYRMENTRVASVLSLLLPHLSQEAYVVLERAKRDTAPVWPPQLHCFSQRSYGETCLWFLRPAESVRPA